ncbi:MAG: formate dehydrogenase accessory protein FdhE [Syntrophomonadaceae bacterium]
MDRKTPVQLPEGYEEFYKELENWQNEKQVYLKKLNPVNKTSLSEVLTVKKKPLLIATGFKVDPEQYREMLFDFISFLKKARPSVADIIDRLAADLDKFDFADITEKLLTGQDLNNLEEASIISPDLALFIFDHALRPFLRVQAEAYQEDLANDDFRSWDLPMTCPICGSQPTISRLRKSDGRRLMFCDHCFAEWEVKYLACAYCQNDEPGTIRYLSVGDTDPYQIYTCDKCRGYIKTYDERQSGQATDLFIANIKTIYLDMLAEEKGYKNHSS